MAEAERAAGAGNGYWHSWSPGGTVDTAKVWFPPPLSKEGFAEAAQEFPSCEGVEASASAKVVSIPHYLKPFLLCLNFWLNKY